MYPYEKVMNMDESKTQFLNKKFHEMYPDDELITIPMTLFSELKKIVNGEIKMINESNSIKKQLDAIVENGGLINLDNIVRKLKDSSLDLDDLSYLISKGIYCKEKQYIKELANKNQPRITMKKNDLGNGKIELEQSYAILFVKTPKKSPFWKKHEEIISKYRDIMDGNGITLEKIISGFDNEEIVQFLDWKIDEKVNIVSQIRSMTFKYKESTVKEQITERLKVLLGFIPMDSLERGPYQRLHDMLNDPNSMYRTPEKCWDCESENIVAVESFSGNGENIPHDLIIYQCGECGEKTPIIPNLGRLDLNCSNAVIIEDEE